MKLNQCSYYTNHRFKFSMKVFHRGGQHATATTTTCWCEWGMCARLLWRKCQLQGTKKVHELLCMQLLQGIVRGQPDCECKEGCKGDPLSKCDCSSNDGNFQFFSNWEHQLKVYYHRWAPQKSLNLGEQSTTTTTPDTNVNINGKHCLLIGC